MVDQLLSVAMVTTLDEMPRLLSVSSAGVAQFEGPEEVVSLLEMRAHRDDLVKKIFDANYSKFTEGFLNDCIV